MALLSCPPRLLPQPILSPLCLCHPLRCPIFSRLSIKSSLAYSHTDHIEKEEAKSKVDLLACPICFEPLIRKGPTGINLSAISRSAFKCNNCKKAFSTSGEVFLDLTVTAGLKKYEEVLGTSTGLYRIPLLSFVYERGWRQSFAGFGFPGPDKEVKLAQEFLKPSAGGILLDVSCGSGLFSRRFAKSDAYSAVIALDFSENMLRETHELVKQDRALDNRNLALIRADVARLPFATGTVDAVHAGAALHCWPSPSVGVAEVCRILRPGGIFVATTLLSSGDLPIDALKPIEQAYMRLTRFKYWLEPELEELCAACGLIDYRKIRRNQFIMLCATKPNEHPKTSG